MEELKACPICDNSSFSSFIKCKDYTVSKEIFTIVSCDDCGFKFTNPRPEVTELGAYYESEEYISHSNTSEGIVNKLYQIARQYTLSKKLKLVNSLSKVPTTILDYGCGTGEFLNTCKSAGWKTQGIEPSAVARKFAQENYQLQVEESVLNASLEKESFKVISLWHVLEHISQLKPTLKELISLLQNDGYLIIAVPNPNSLDAKVYHEEWAAYDVPRHLYHFTPETIQKLFEVFELKLIRQLPMTLDSFYVSLLSEKYRNENNSSFSLLSFPRAFWNGFRSNINSAFTQGTSSSQIYIFQKNAI